MSTASFDKEFIVTDPKAIEQLLYDLEHAPKPKIAKKAVTVEDIERKRQILKGLKRISQK